MSEYTEFFGELVRFEIELWGRLDAAQVAEAGISVAQLQALSAIAARRGAARVQDVSTELQITVGAASKLIDRLERDGLANRAAHPTDRRSMVIALSPAGDTAHREARDAAERHLKELLGGALTERQASDLGSALAAVRRSLSAEAVA